MIKLPIVIGGRPKVIRAATVSRQVDLRSDIDEVIVHAGQRFDAIMSDIFFDAPSIPKPRRQLRIGGASCGTMTGSRSKRRNRHLLVTAGVIDVRLSLL